MVTCLNGQLFTSEGGPVRIRGLVEIEDDGSPGAGRDSLQIEPAYIYLGGPTPPPPDVPITNCPASLPGDGVALSTGTADFTGRDFPQNYVVTDTQPPPTTKAHCKHGSWRAYPQFRNQGDCVSCVATAGKEPAG